MSPMLDDHPDLNCVGNNKMAPPMMNNPLIFAEAYGKSDSNNNSLRNEPMRSDVKPIKRTTKNSLNNVENIVVVKEREFPAELPGPEYKMELVWRNIIIFFFLHMGAVYGQLVPKRAWATVIFTFIYGFAGGFGITAGSHRLFAHKAYKANKALKILLLYFQTIAFQNSAFEWARDHRVHHKFCDTNADPHNARRGFFFSHMGWLLCKKHTDVKKFGNKVDMSDLEADPLIMFQHKHYMLLMPMISIIIPTLVPWLCWGETLKASFFLVGVYRYVLSLHITWLINSAAHMYGMKPFDKEISPADSKIVGFLAFGEGFHNFHHVFPWDYKTSELGIYYCNFSTAFLDFFAWLGWATDLKTVSDDLLRKRIQRTGDGSHKYSQLKTREEKLMAYVHDRTTDANGNHIHHEEDTLWGWDDEAMPEEDKQYVTITHKQKNAVL